MKVYIDSAHAIAHNKVMLIDGHTLITGSFNFTKAAEDRNAENLLVLESPEAVGLYGEEFRRHLGHSLANSLWPLFLPLTHLFNPKPGPGGLIPLDDLALFEELDHLTMNSVVPPYFGPLPPGIRRGLVF